MQQDGLDCSKKENGASQSILDKLDSLASACARLAHCCPVSVHIPEPEYPENDPLGPFLHPFGALRAGFDESSEFRGCARVSTVIHSFVL